MYVSLLGLYCGFDIATRATFSPMSQASAEGCTQNLTQWFSGLSNQIPTIAIKQPRSSSMHLTPHHPPFNTRATTFREKLLMNLQENKTDDIIQNWPESRRSPSN